MKKLSQKEVEKRYLESGLIVLDLYISSFKSLKYKCIKMEHIHTSLPVSIFQGTGCKLCSDMNRRFTLEEIDKKLKDENRKLERYGDWSKYKNTNDKMFWKCLDCSYTWNTMVGGVLYSKHNCPECNVQSQRLTISSIIERLINDKRTIEVCDKTAVIKTAHDIINWKCLGCNNIWPASPNNTLNHWKGCPKCSFGKCQKIVLHCLEEYGVNFESEKYLQDIATIDNDYHIDFYLPDQNIIIEYNGRQHYQPVCFGGMTKEAAAKIFDEYQQPRDIIVQKFCIDNNIKLIIIDGRKFEANIDKLKIYMSNVILPQIKNKYE